MLRIGALALVALVGACAPMRDPLLLSEQFDPSLVRKIALPPIVDVRPDRFEQVLATVRARHAALRVLSDKGYRVEEVELPERLRSMSPLEVSAASPELLASAFAGLDTYVLLLFLERLDREGEGPGETSVTISAILLDLRAGRALWRDRSAEHSTLGGLLTVLSGGSAGYEAVYQAVRGVLRTLPSKPQAAGSIRRHNRSSVGR